MAKASILTTALVVPALLAIPALLVSTACITSPIGGVDWSLKPVDAIALTGGHDLEGKQVRITDREEIDRILKLMRRTGTFGTQFISFDFDQVQVVSIGIEQGAETNEVSTVSGCMATTSDDGSFYAPSDAQAELWDLVLKHLSEPTAEVVSQ